MAAKCVILAFAVTMCHAAPFTIIGKNYSPVLRNPQSLSGLHPYQPGSSQAYSSVIANSDGAYGKRITYNGLLPNYGSAASSAQNFGNAGLAVAQSNTGLGSAGASASNLRGLGYGSAVSSANSNHGFGSAISSADNSGYGSAVSSAQARGGLGEYSSAQAASENVGGVRASTSHAIQQSHGAVQHSGATSIDGPGIQAAYSHTVNNGYY